MIFENRRDANSYLASTVCFFDGRPIYIEGIDDDLQALCYDLPITGASVHRRVDINSPLFNCREYKLGYMNSTGGAYYVSRRPARGTAQGICDNNLSFLRVDQLGRGRGMTVQTAIREQGFADMLLGVYPSVHDAVAEMAQPNVKDRAVSRFLCIKQHPQFSNLRFLEYKGEEISFSETHEFDLPADFNYLREICAPSGVLKVA